MPIKWKTGYEIELMAPAGMTREGLANIAAKRLGGRVERFFHPQSEPSEVPGQTAFENLTFGFKMEDAEGRHIASYVDDITLQNGLNRNAQPKDWYRIVSDDARLLALVALHCNPNSPLKSVLEPMAKLFGSKIDRHPSGMVKIVDDRKVPIVLGATLPGERERPCEIVTAPLETDHEETLTSLLKDAVNSGFTVPRESATHIHFDAEKLKNTGAFSNLVKLLHQHGPALKRVVKTNPNCVRLGGWSRQFIKLVTSDDFVWMPWEQACEAMKETKPTKYCDFNVFNIVHDLETKSTFEVRILPTSLDAEPLIEATALFEAILNWCAATPAAGDRIPGNLKELVATLQLEPEYREVWQARV